VSENPLGLGLVVVGAVALAISVFLPLVQPVNALRMVQDNTLIQHGGWVLLACALGIVGSGYRASQGKRSERWLLIVVCAFAALLLVQDINDKGLRTLYPIRPDGTLDTSQAGVVAGLGIAIYVAGAGVAAALMGALTFFQSSRNELADIAPTRQRNSGVQHQRADQPRPDRKRERTREVLEAEAAEAEAQAAEARARAIRLRIEAQGDAKPPPEPEHSEPPQGPRTPTPPRKASQAKPRNSPARANGLRLGDQVQVVAPSDPSYLKYGTVTRILDNGEVEVKLGVLSGTCTCGSDELKFVGRKNRW
jgi:hypothetical protein